MGFFVATQVLVHRLIRFEVGAYLAGLVRPVVIAAFVFLGLALCRTYLIDSFLTDGLSRVLFNLVPGLGPARLEAVVILVQAAFLSLALYGLALRLFAWGLCRDYWRNLRGRAPEALQ